MNNTRKIRRQKVEDKIAEVSPWDLSGSPEDICKELREIQDTYLNQYPKEDIIDSCWTWVSASYDGDDGRFTLKITRLENDREYDRRVKQLMKIKEQEKYIMEKEAKAEYEEYLRLNKKYGTINNEH